MKKYLGILFSTVMMFTSVNFVNASVDYPEKENSSVKVSLFRNYFKNITELEPETGKITETTTVTEATTEATTVTEAITEATTVTETITEATTVTETTTVAPKPTENVAAVKDITFSNEKGLFVVPDGYSISQNMQSHLDRLNKNLKTKIVIMIDNIKKPVTAADIASFTDYNTGAIDYNKVWSYCAKIMDTYNTASYSRKFKTHDGVIVNVPVGDYGWKVDMTGLTKNLYQSLVNFKDNTFTYKSSKKAFAGAQTVYGNDIGGTYIEIDLTNQTVHWFKNGVCVLSDYCVTGKKSTPTPAGTWSLKCNSGRTQLNGPTWSVWVSYWAHFSQGCGLHDATWQSSFGPARWKAGYGSHGCVNLPLATAKKAHSIMQVGEPVVVYYR